MTRLPILPTILVAAAAAVMVALGIWQLGRSEEKNAMIARFSEIPKDQAARPLVADGEWQEELLYQRLSFDCGTPIGMRSTAATSDNGAKGWSHVAKCSLDGGQQVEVALGWTISAVAPDWKGGAVTGVLGPKGKLVADPPLADLGALAAPDPNDLPNNHLAYAGQWFFFALTALVIYGFALRSRRRKRG